MTTIELSRLDEVIAARTKPVLENGQLSFPAATSARGFVQRTADGTFNLASEDAGLEPDRAKMTAPFIITTARRDRYGDVVMPRGCEKHLTNYARNPVVFFGHKSTGFPIGSARRFDNTPDVTVFDDKVVSVCHFHNKTPEAVAVFALVAEKELRSCSIGFRPVVVSLIEPDEDQVKNRPDETPDGEKVGYSGDYGLRFLEWDLLEWSIVAVPANPDCIHLHLDRGHIHGEKIPDNLRASLKAMLPPRPLTLSVTPPTITTKAFSVAELAKLKETSNAEPVAAKRKPDRWSKSLGPAFDVTEENLRPATTEYEFVSKYLDCKVKDIYQTNTFVPSAKLGSFLSGWREATSAYRIVDVRNITGDGAERPPVYETIQLNSTKTDDFLVDGVVFHAGEQLKFVASLAPSWWGLSLTLYTKATERQVGPELVNRAWELAASKFNFLKGEAFSLGGDFIPKTAETWGDVFVSQKNEDSLARTIRQLNEKKDKFANRGTIFMGPPGTGKTLSGRVIRNQTDSTFIWVSARDFYRSGSFGGIRYAFELAKELAPTVLFIEDVDNWLDSYSVDLLKTEMDGIGRYSGVWTILTTNFPEDLPEALIDRPGRFHDVLMFDLPDATNRRRMFNRWLPDLTAEPLEKSVKETEGYSGAHVYELAYFAKTICEQDNKPLAQAVDEALTKIKEQRLLIGKAKKGQRRSAESDVRVLEVFPYSSQSAPVVSRMVVQPSPFLLAANIITRDGVMTDPLPSLSPHPEPDGDEKEEKPALPLGAQFLAACLDHCTSAHSHANDHVAQIEQPRVKSYAKKRLGRVTREMDRIREIACSVYPDCGFDPPAVPAEEPTKEIAATKKDPLILSPDDVTSLLSNQTLSLGEIELRFSPEAVAHIQKLITSTQEKDAAEKKFMQVLTALQKNNEALATKIFQKTGLRV